MSRESRARRNTAHISLILILKGKLLSGVNAISTWYTMASVCTSNLNVSKHLKLDSKIINYRVEYSIIYGKM